MRTAFLTLDEVNAQHAIALGSRCKQSIHLVDLRSPDLVHERVLVIDLDSIPAAEHPRLFALLLPRAAGKIAVHSFHLPPETIRDLRRAGVIVRKRLDATLFRRLDRRHPVAVAGS